MALFWYSSATGLTGGKLAEDLGLDGHSSRELPNLRNVDKLICWGCKTNRNYSIPNRVRVLNHPNAIRLNRNKLKALEKMRDTDRNLVPEFKTRLTDEDIRTKRWVGRTKYHQGGKGFWLILNKDDYENAKAEGAQYFQEHVNIKNEYRLHIFRDEMIYAVRKVKHSDPAASWKAIVKEDLEGKIDNVNNEDLDRILNAAVKRITLPDRIIRSNKRGWKFSRITRVPEELISKAVLALRAIGLDFGAVDMVETLEGNCFVIEVNTGPGLKGTSYERWLEKFRTYLSENNNGANNENPRLREARAEAINEVHAEAVNVRNNAENIENGNAQAKIVDSVKGLVINLDFSNVSEEDKRKINKIEINVT